MAERRKILEYTVVGVVLAVVVTVAVGRTAVRYFLAQRSSGNTVSEELRCNFWTGTEGCAGAPGS